MAKVTGPIFSVEAHGALGDGICYTGSMGGARVILNPTHKDAYSTGQSIQRSSFITGKSMWKALSAASKAYYNGLAADLAMTGYNFYIKKVLLGQIGGIVWITDSFAGQVGASADDCYVRTNGSVWAISLTIAIGELGSMDDLNMKQGGGLRFLNVAIPKSATILTAHLHVTPSVNGSEADIYCKIIGDKEANAATFTLIADYQARRGTACGGANNDLRTVEETSWHWPSSITQDVEIESPDITTVIQELVNQAAWASGNAMALFLDDHDGVTALWHGYTYRSYNGNPTKAARLHITYKYQG